MCSHDTRPRGSYFSRILLTLSLMCFDFPCSLEGHQMEISIEKEPSLFLTICNFLECVTDAQVQNRKYVKLLPRISSSHYSLVVQYPAKLFPTEIQMGNTI